MAVYKTPSGLEVDAITGQPPTAPVSSPDLGGTYTGLGGTFKPNTPINSTVLAPSSPLNITPISPTPVPNIANIPITEPQKTTPEATNPLIKSLEEFNAKLSSKESTLSAGISSATSSYESQLNEINKQIRMHQANALANQEKALASGETLSFASGEAQRVQRNDAIETLKLSALAEAMQGNITLAEKQAKRSIDAQFAQVENDSRAARQNIINNYESFTPAEKKRADATLATLNEKDAFVAREKENRTEIFKVTNTAMANAGSFVPTLEYPTINVASDAMHKSKTPEDAQSIAIKTGLTKPLTAQSDFEQAFTREHGYPPTTKDLLAYHTQVAAAGRAPELTDATVNADVLKGMLNVYKSTGVLPPFGLSAKSPLRAQFFAALGAEGGNQIVTDATVNKSIRAGLATAYKTQQNQLSANQTAIGTLDKQLSLAQNYSDKVNRSGSPLVAKYILGLKSGVFGDPDAAALNNIVKTASYEFAKILSGSAASIAGVTVSSAADAESMLNSAMSKGQFNEVVGLMQKEANFRLNSQKDTIKQLEKDMQNINNLSSIVETTPNDVANLAKAKNISNSELQDSISKYGLDAVRKFLSGK